MPWSLRTTLFWDLILGVLGVSAFLTHLGSDLWAVSQYVLSGHYLWATLVLTLLGLSSVVLQVFSWVWMRADPTDLHSSQPSGRCLALLHLLQLGYLYRCMQGLRQGLLVWQQEVPSEFDLAYADFLSMDISMLRLFETFLEKTPQLTLVLAIVLQSGQTEYYQWASICTSFFGISWALLDYHRALRTCLPSKPVPGLGSSVIYFLWNLLLLWPRVLAVALFSALFPRYVTLHFLGLWLVLLFWVWVQGTNFMLDPCSEWLYRAVVATILYFAWFNVTEGRTRDRSIIHVVFLLSDSVLMVITWVTQSAWLPSGILLHILLPASGISFLLGLVLRLVYYRWLHPSRRWEPAEVDGTRGLRCLQLYQLPQNRRMVHLAQNFFPKAWDEAASPWEREVKGVL
ncbi:XK related 8 [Phyllostomus discolor]|uniref:XK-related protein n=2 Tax=Phyllostomus discolor TaxID=89673 RepID=A0A6J2LPM9_9CHIR|nr:XK-related protein 8 [Phyllostomus discolor]KAF6112301.1 XK related 8 [Phyllostomus discolor]